MFTGGKYSFQIFAQPDHTVMNADVLKCWQENFLIGKITKQQFLTDFLTVVTLFMVRVNSELIWRLYRFILPVFTFILKVSTVAWRPYSPLEQEYQTINLQLNIFLAIPKIKTAILLFEMWKALTKPNL